MWQMFVAFVIALIIATSSAASAYVAGKRKSLKLKRGRDRNLTIQRILRIIKKLKKKKNRKKLLKK